MPDRRILICGAAGQIGRTLMAAAWPAGLVPLGLTRAELDLTDRTAVAAAVHRLAPAAVVNAAAYTAVDKAEAEPAAAYAINRDGAAGLADACRRAGIPLLHLSTDYVFDGTKLGPYTEDDPVAPLGVYARSKLAGERAVRERLPDHLILRTAWVFSAHRRNFVTTMLRLGAERDELRVVDDQVGCPTAAGDVAAAVVEILRQWAARGVLQAGTYHLCGTPPTTWRGLAEATFACAEAFWGRRPRVVAIPTADYPTPARRPANSVLDTSRLSRTFGIAAADWRIALGRVVAEVLGPQAAPPRHAVAHA